MFVFKRFSRGGKYEKFAKLGVLSVVIMTL